MKITFDNNPKQVELLKACASNNKETASAARESFAALLRPVLEQIILQADTVSPIYEDFRFDENTDNSFPLYPYFDEGVDQFTIWSQDMAGGLASNYVTGNAEIRFQTYSLDSALSFGKRYAKNSRLDVVAAALTKFANTFRVKQNLLGWNVLMKALANATTGGRQHVIRAETSAVFVLNDLNKLLSRAKRVLASYANGTPDPMSSKGVTDIAASVEILEQIRSMAYQPVNTRQATSGVTSIPAPEAVRNALWDNAGIDLELYGISFHELNELGRDATQSVYNTMFRLYAGGTSYATQTGGSGGTFGANDEILVGWDATRQGAFRPIETSEGAALNLQVDDQFPVRADKMGWFGGIKEGRIIVENRKFSGIIATSI